MATVKRHYVTIKGVKDGLIFILDDTCEFKQLIAELKFKLEKSHERILTGPIIHVHIKLGKRSATEEQKKQIRDLIGSKGNLLIQSIESADPAHEHISKDGTDVKTVRGIVRSGQTMVYEGNILFLGDVNPGGSIVSSGSIYVMGALRGMAHAGCDGDEKAVIAASQLRPTQLRIAGIISRPPDEWAAADSTMEFACVKDGRMEIDKIHHMHRLM